MPSLRHLLLVEHAAGRARPRGPVCCATFASVGGLMSLPGRDAIVRAKFCALGDHPARGRRPGSPRPRSARAGDEVNVRARRRRLVVASFRRRRPCTPRSRTPRAAPRDDRLGGGRGARPRAGGSGGRFVSVALVVIFLALRHRCRRRAQRRDDDRYVLQPQLFRGLAERPGRLADGLARHLLRRAEADDQHPAVVGCLRLAGAAGRVDQVER